MGTAGTQPCKSTSPDCQWQGDRERDRERDHSSLEPTQPSTPTLQPQAGLFLLGRCILAVTAHSWTGFGWSCWGWLELDWKGVGLCVAWGKGAQGTAGVMESMSPTAFSSSQTKGSLGTQALDPTAVTQHAEGHFISSSSFFS